MSYSLTKSVCGMEIIMIKRRRAYFSAACVAAAVVSLAGCGRGESASSKNKVEDLTASGDISWEMADGISPDAKDFEDQLVSGNYYVVHDGLYYPVASYIRTSTKVPTTYVEDTRMQFFTTETENQIPTLFAGDTLVYYSTDALLDYVVWERYYDLGYTIGVYDILSMTNGRQYLDLSEDCIITDSELYAMYDLGENSVLLDKIGGQQITADFIDHGIITGTQKSRTYDLEVYNGTYYQHYSATANIHAFRAYELFASVEYETLQDCFYEVQIPEYLVDGYYDVNSVGLLRLVREESYSDETEFNEQLLFPKTEYDYSTGEYVPSKTIWRYSTFESLNNFSTNVEGALGYVPEDDDTTEGSDGEESDSEYAATVLKEATIKEIDLWFPEGRNCTIKIKSSTGELTGDIYVEMGNTTKLITYNRIDGVYENTFTGKGEKGTLTVSGLFKTYDIELVNCEQYTGQDAQSGGETATEGEAEDEEEEPAEETETEVGNAG
jgi:hypothetical protein